MPGISLQPVVVNPRISRSANMLCPHPRQRSTNQNIQRMFLAPEIWPMLPLRRYGLLVQTFFGFPYDTADPPISKASTGISGPDKCICEQLRREFLIDLTNVVAWVDNLRCMLVYLHFPRMQSLRIVRAPNSIWDTALQRIRKQARVSSCRREQILRRALFSQRSY